jgi:hypothetical protein
MILFSLSIEICSKSIYESIGVMMAVVINRKRGKVLVICV